jgi:Mg/Co/Ni transporter MgtE
LALVSFVFFIVGVWFFRKVWRHYWLLGLGIVFIARFVIVRAATFYGVALPELSRFTGGVRINWLLEFVGAFIIFLGAGWNLRQTKVRKKTE